MKKLTFLFLLLLASCTSTSSGSNSTTGVPGLIYSTEVKLPNGQMVTCVAWSGDSVGEGGLSCDWSRIH